MGVIAIDWSGAKRPKNKIWIAEANNGSLSRLDPVASREQALEQVVEQLARAVSWSGSGLAITHVTLNGFVNDPQHPLTYVSIKPQRSFVKTRGRDNRDVVD